MRGVCVCVWERERERERKREREREKTGRKVQKLRLRKNKQVKTTRAAASGEEQVQRDESETIKYSTLTRNSRTSASAKRNYEKRSVRAAHECLALETHADRGVRRCRGGAQRLRRRALVRVVGGRLAAARPVVALHHKVLDLFDEPVVDDLQDDIRYRILYRTGYHLPITFCKVLITQLN